MSGAKLTLSVQAGIRATGLPAASTLRRWASATLERDARVTLRFVGMAEGRRLNQRYRRKDYATNVLTFVYDDHFHDAPRDAPGVSPVAGDIVICVPVVRREARAAGRMLRAHFAHLVVHGMLHLQGYDHQHDRDATRMERRETELLRRFRYHDPYAAAERHRAGPTPPRPGRPNVAAARSPPPPSRRGCATSRSD